MRDHDPIGNDPGNASYADWTQLARRSRSIGIGLTHYVAGSSELTDVTVDGFCVALGRSVPSHFEIREGGGGRWQTPPAGIGLISCLPPGCEVSVRWEGRAESINLTVEPGWLDGQGEHARPFSIKRPSYCLHDGLTADLIEEIYRDNLADSPFGLAYSEALAIAVLHRIGAIDSRREKHATASKTNRAIEIAVAYIDANLDAELSLGDIVAATHYHSTLPSFSKAFKTYCGRPPHQYIIERRLERAKTMLSGSRASITEIALNCGFSSLSHFSGAFKRRWGVSPTDIVLQRH